MGNAAAVPTSTAMTEKAVVTEIKALTDRLQAQFAEDTWDAEQAQWLNHELGRLKTAAENQAAAETRRRRA